MSLVGPRPYLAEEIEKVKPLPALIFEVKPGITGMWQISGRSDIPFAERLRIDEHYIRNWSLWMDIIILFKTFGATHLRPGRVLMPLEIMRIGIDVHAAEQDGSGNCTYIRGLVRGLLAVDRENEYVFYAVTSRPSVLRRPPPRARASGS